MKTKLLKSLMLIACLLVGFNISAYDFTVDGIYYYGSSDLTCSVANSPSESKYTGEVVIPNTVTYNNKTYMVTAIGYGAFSGCSGLTSITIPDGVTSIGDNAFSDCSGLTSITIPDGVTSIGDNAFWYCTGLTSITIPDGVTAIGYMAFCGCSALTSIYIPAGVTAIESYTFQSCLGLTSISIPDGVTVIGYQAFYGCSRLTSITIPDGVTAIGNQAFSGCSGLTSITIPDKIESIGAYAFQSVSCFNGILNLPASLKTIGSSVFSSSSYSVCKIAATTPPTIKADSFNESLTVIVPKGCSAAYSSATNWSKYTIIEENGNIAEVTVSTPGRLAVDIMNQAGIAPAKVTNLKVHGTINETDIKVMKSNMKACYSIDLSDADCSVLPADAFRDKAILIDLKLPNNCTAIGNNAFSGCTVLSGEIMLPSGVVSIGDYAFSGCQLISKVIFNPSLKSIGNYTFSGCNKLKQDIVLSGDISIGASAFSGCKEITSIVLPTTITSISQGAFSGCSNLKNLDLSSNKQLSTIGDYSFQNCAALSTINLPESLTAVGVSAFSGCSGLNSISVPCTVPPIAGANSFNQVNTDECILSIPTESYIDYLIAEHWGAFIEMRKEIAVNVEGNGLITFEKNPTTQSKASLYNGMRINKTDQQPTGSTIVRNGSSLYVKKDESVSFHIIPDDGYLISQVLYNNVDVTNEVVNNTFTTPAVSTETTLKVSFIENTIRVSSITLNVTKGVIKYGTKATLKATVAPNNAKDKSITWSSSNESVATVNNTGEITGIKLGTATITATANDGSGVAATCELTVDVYTDVDGVYSPEVKVFTIGRDINISGDNMAVEVFNSTGIMIYSGTDNLITMPTSGIYIVKVAGKTYKVIVK